MSEQKSFEIGGVEYDKRSSMLLRDDLIQRRDAELSKEAPDFKTAVMLSHAIGWMWAMIVEVFGGDISELAPKR